MSFAAISFTIFFEREENISIEAYLTHIFLHFKKKASQTARFRCHFYILLWYNSSIVITFTSIISHSKKKDRSKPFALYVTEQFVQIVHMTAQDRRITKTRKAIYAAFLQLLNQKNFEPSLFRRS